MFLQAFSLQSTAVLALRVLLNHCAPPPCHHMYWRICVPVQAALGYGADSLCGSHSLQTAIDQLPSPAASNASPLSWTIALMRGSLPCSSVPFTFLLFFPPFLHPTGFSCGQGLLSALSWYSVRYSIYLGINSCHTNFSFRNSCVLIWYSALLIEIAWKYTHFSFKLQSVSAFKLVFTYIYPYLQLPDGSAGKESAYNAGDLGLIPELERIPGKGNSMKNFLHENFFSCSILAWKFFLAWKLPGRRDPGRLQSKGLQRVGHDWATKHGECFLPPNQFIVCVLSARLGTGYFTCITFWISACCCWLERKVMPRKCYGAAGSAWALLHSNADFPSWLSV